jgi:hypothetical protein
MHTNKQTPRHVQAAALAMAVAEYFNRVYTDGSAPDPTSWMEKSYPLHLEWIRMAIQELLALQTTGAAQVGEGGTQLAINTACY